MIELDKIKDTIVYSCFLIISLGDWLICKGAGGNFKDKEEAKKKTSKEKATKT